MGSSKKRLQIAIFAVVLLIAGYTVAGGAFQGDPKPPETGQKVPAFSLTGLDEQTYDPAKLKGKPLVINFWGTFCPPCVEETPALQRMYEKYKEDGVVILGVNLGEKPLVRVKNFTDRFGVSYPVLLDPELEVRDRYGVRSYPTTFFVDAEGVIREIKVGGMTEGYIESRILKLLNK
ncbi:TlpA disulfide reductase family protein [Paenibacillus alkalitolerans]|uniref:TlpA disulfide reductase family protein n=1 Tax=Paenibacillus alkalitolerans TaxID=2799335 RepID=UPI0018F785EB|nr:TlpA disulfide reductase family protein [Paenibacillus alkalitolerans]